MFRQQTTDREFWSRKRGLREIDMTVVGTTEDIRSGSAEGWGALWRLDQGEGDESLWEAFYAGDAPLRREERWLLGA